MIEKRKALILIKKEVYMLLLLIAVAAFFVLGILSLLAHNFTRNMVKTELTAQKIYFPEKGSPSLDPTTYPDLQKYAGQLVDTPEKAQAYANGYIGRHLKKVADGKVYAEVSAEAMKDPENQKLQQQKQTLFQGETLRALLLGNGYAFGMIGKIAGITAYIAFSAAGAMLILAAILRTKL